MVEDLNLPCGSCTPDAEEGVPHRWVSYLDDGPHWRCVNCDAVYLPADDVERMAYVIGRYGSVPQPTKKLAEHVLRCAVFLLRWHAGDKSHAPVRTPAR